MSMANSRVVHIYVLMATHEIRITTYGDSMRSRLTTNSFPHASMADKSYGVPTNNKS
jgi:hypothetical protein